MITPAVYFDDAIVANEASGDLWPGGPQERAAVTVLRRLADVGKIKIVTPTASPDPQLKSPSSDVRIAFAEEHGCHWFVTTDPSVCQRRTVIESQCKRIKIATPSELVFEFRVL